MQNLIASIQRVLIANKNRIIGVMLGLEVLMPIVWAYGAYVFVTQPENYSGIYEAGLWFGKVAFLLYITTLIPGILRRLQVQPLIQATIMPFRRHLGILMFLTAVVHFGYVSSIPVYFTQPFTPPVLTTHQTLGMLSLMLLLPLWLTSNDFSQKRLKKFWKYVHRLTHVAVFAIFAHVALANWWLGAIGLVVLIANVVSWGKVILGNRHEAQVSGQETVSSEQ